MNNTMCVCEFYILNDFETISNKHGATQFYHDHKQSQTGTWIHDASTFRDDHTIELPVSNVVRYSDINYASFFARF